MCTAVGKYSWECAFCAMCYDAFGEVFPNCDHEIRTGLNGAHAWNALYVAGHL